MNGSTFFAWFKLNAPWVVGQTKKRTKMKLVVKQNGLLVCEKELLNNYNGSKGKITVRCKNTGYLFVETEGTIEDASKMKENTYECPNCQSTDCSQVEFEFICKTNPVTE